MTRPSLFVYSIATGHGRLTLSVAGKRVVLSMPGIVPGSCQAADLSALNRLLSACSEAGVSLAPIIETLSDITCCPVWDEGVQVRSPADGMAQLLARHVNGEPSELVQGALFDGTESPE